MNQPLKNYPLTNIMEMLDVVLPRYIDKQYSTEHRTLLKYGDINSMQKLQASELKEKQALNHIREIVVQYFRENIEGFE